MFKDVFVVHPDFLQTPRRSLVAADLTKQYLTGRWVMANGSGQFDIVSSSRALNNAQGLYWLIEGTHVHIGNNTTDFATVGGVAFTSINNTQLPSNQAQGALAGVYGVFVGQVGPEGVDPTAAIVNGSILTVDQYGRLIVATGSNIVVAVAEVVAVDGSNNITSLIFRTTGN